jgi:hypothetical protein
LTVEGCWKAESSASFDDLRIFSGGVLGGGLMVVNSVNVIDVDMGHSA